MTVKKGLKTLVESTPNFSNQALENAINDIKNIDCKNIENSFFFKSGSALQFKDYDAASCT